jgi:hypothetical protein
MRPCSALPLVLVATAALACDAGFTDLRPPRDARGDLVDPFVDPLLDQGRADAGRGTDGGADLTLDVGADMGADALPADASAADTDTSAASDTSTTDPIDDPGAGASERLVARGDFENINYQTFGTAEIWALADGTFELRFSDDFVTTDDIPGPAVALSVNPDISPSLVASEGDVDLGALQRAQGAQSYTLPFAPGPREYAWVWCQPFGVEVARARLVAP